MHDTTDQKSTGQAARASEPLLDLELRDLLTRTEKQIVIASLALPQNSTDRQITIARIAVNQALYDVAAALDIMEPIELATPLESCHHAGN